ALLGTDAFQETDVMGISMPVTKWNVQVTRAAEIPAALAKAFHIARTGRPGPVLVDITKDAQLGLLDFTYEPCTGFRSYHPKPELSHSAVQEAAHLLDRARKPLMVVGQGVLLANAEEELLRFAEKTGMPVASTLLGLGAFPTDHPLYVGFVGMHGDYAPNIKTNACDVLLAAGMRFDDRVTGDISRYAKQAKVVHVDIDAAEINKIITADVAVHADAKDALRALTALVQPRQHADWLQEFSDAKAVEVETLAQHTGTTGELRMDEVVQLLSARTGGEALVVTDVGQHQMVTARHYRYRSTRSNITSGGLGTMGFALPAAIGAKLAAPERTVVAVIGDGGFQMTLQELGTIMQSKVAVKVLILNNRFLGMVRQWQQLFFEKRYSFTEMVSPDFVTLAKAYGIAAERVEARENLEQGMARMLGHAGPYLLEVMVEKEDNVFPMVPTGASVSEIRLA
ncbi:MAG: biosynthetic-type acetolactate synthase large subunit, partial [Bacteroidetes bacterium]|nr:biosynthetic-type acetolactate synthase large subunit [Bacteroidota bacterium]